MKERMPGLGLTSPSARRKTKVTACKKIEWKACLWQGKLGIIQKVKD